MVERLDVWAANQKLDYMTLLLVLIAAAVLVFAGIVIGVHNAKSSTVAPLAKKAQKVGKKALASARKRLP